MRLCERIKSEPKRQEAFRRAYLEMAAASRLFAEPQGKVENSVAPRVWKAIDASLDGESKFEGGKPGFAYAQNPESSGLFRTLAFLKHGVTFRSLVVDIEKNGHGYEKLLQVHQDYYRLMSGQLPMDRLKLKFNLNHFSIIVQGFDFGLDQLNEIELAACLDVICPCAERHSEEYFRKLRARIWKVCQKIISDTESTSWRIG
jgi:hypothetical protein